MRYTFIHEGSVVDALKGLRDKIRNSSEFTH